jgi:hypothetical protein
MRFKGEVNSTGDEIAENGSDRAATCYRYDFHHRVIYRTIALCREFDILWGMAHYIRRMIVVPVFLALLAPLSGQERYGTGLDPTPEQLLKASRNATPPAEVVESLGEIELPPSLDLTDRFPVPGNQGQIGSCGGWAVAYAAKSFQEKSERDWSLDRNSHRFSPSFLYNQVNGGRDGGSSFPDLFTVLMTRGAASLATMPYTTDYLAQPSNSAFEEATQFPILSYNRLPADNHRAIKSMLVEGKAVVFGMVVTESFTRYRGGTFDSATGRSLGGHAMALVGYDDSRNAYRIINSWGTGWGDGGYAWIDYNTFARYTRDVWVLEDEVSTPTVRLLPPVDVSAGLGTSTEFVEISWAPAAASGRRDLSYRIYRANLETREFGAVGTSRSDSFRDTEALPGVTYLYAVASSDASGESGLSTVASGMRAEPQSVPGRPDGLLGRDTGAAVEVTWSPVSGADYYDVYRMDPVQGYFMSTGASRDESFTDPGVTDLRGSESSVSYIVRAVNGHGTSEFSYPVSVLLEGSSSAGRQSSEPDDRIIPKPQAQSISVERNEYDLFDPDEIYAYFQEAYAAEQEAFRRYRQEEADSFESFRSREDDAFQQYLEGQN